MGHKERKLVMVKLGGSVITEINNPFTARIKTIKRLVSEEARAKKETGFSLLQGHGGGSFAHDAAVFYKLRRKSSKAIAMTQVALKDINSIIVDRLARVGLRPFPFHPSNIMYSNNGQIQEAWCSGINIALDKGLTPVVHGDVLLDATNGIHVASTESVFLPLAFKLHPKKIVLVTDVAGVFDSNPKTNPDAKLIPIIDSSNVQEVIKLSAGKATGRENLTGAMGTKVELAYLMAKFAGTTVYIANGNKPGLLRDILLDKEGAECTIIRA
ncbi:MAG: hypothetical protein KGH49_00775 [Candidatus Micrarchaeota archaeon]|nr:hypothetical protein [Candidatus Micrarchaeota archaeon]